MKRSSIVFAVVLLAFSRFTVFAQEQQLKLYPHFPESFETDDKRNYNIDDVTLPTGRWRMDNALSQCEPWGDWPTSGTHAVRIQQNLNEPAYLQMMFDVPNGARKVTLQYGCWGNDKPCMWQLEYSTNKGKRWQKIDELMVTTNKKKKEAVFDMDIQGPVRFRINKIGLGNGKDNPGISNGRLSLDDFAIYYE